MTVCVVYVKLTLCFTYACMYASVCMYVCMCACTYVHMYVYVYMFCMCMNAHEILMIITKDLLLIIAFVCKYNVAFTVSFQCPVFYTKVKTYSWQVYFSHF